MVDAVASEDGWISRDSNGKITVFRFIHGERVKVVLAADDIDFVVTIHGERGRRR